VRQPIWNLSEPVSPTFTDAKLFQYWSDGSKRGDELLKTTRSPSRKDTDPFIILIPDFIADFDS
jgi:hypothetical protein